MLQIFFRFLSLGLISFGGPAAHIAYFRQTFVRDLAWLDDKHYAGLVSLSQFLPGPGSSQVGFAIGYHRGGLAGALAAFAGFTLPSFSLLFLLVVSSGVWLEYPMTQGIIHGLKLLAVVVVADAVWIMSRQFCKRKPAKLLMVVGCVAILLQPGIGVQFALLIFAAVAGKQWLADVDSTVEETRTPIGLNYLWLGFFVLMLIASSVVVSSGSDRGISGLAQLFAHFFQVGSMVFGGGHVVLPLLQSSVGDGIGNDQFLTGYALAQAVPGPMFSLAAFLGGELWQAQPLTGAIIATLAIFLPGFLLMLVALESWHQLSNIVQIAGAVAGVNACVVGFLLAALYQPIFISSVLSATDMILVAAGFGLLKLFKPHILMMVALFICAGAASAA
ncbi:chromate efflux transporter [Shewanella atlantica]|uniref:chromate efflux transporter n=1 Tax=Shewanella atlantica TaxID=271099 RepID=UPI003734FC53